MPKLFATPHVHNQYIYRQAWNNLETRIDVATEKMNKKKELWIRNNAPKINV